MDAAPLGSERNHTADDDVYAPTILRRGRLRRRGLRSKFVIWRHEHNNDGAPPNISSGVSGDFMLGSVVSAQSSFNISEY